MFIHMEFIVFAILFVLYWWVLAKLVGEILESPKLKRVFWILLGMLNVAAVLTIQQVRSDALLSFLMMMGLMLAEFMIFFRDRFASALLCMLACCIHVSAMFMIVIGAMSAVTGYSPYVIMTTQTYFVRCAAISFLLLDAAIMIVTRVVPLAKVRVVNQHEEQQWFVNAWMIVNSLFLLFMANLFYTPGYPVYLAKSQIAASIICLAGLYIILFFSFKTSYILGYKVKNEKLEHAIHQEQQYRNSMVQDAVASYEVNITQDVVLKGISESDDVLEHETNCYSDLLIHLSQKKIYSADIGNFVINNGRTNVLRLFDRGERELNAEYRRLMVTGEYIWVRATINLLLDKENGDVKAFICVKNIDDEKKKQLDLQRKAERDSLTGLYNRSTANKLIDEYLTVGTRSVGAALFMIDVDHFKEINDHLGHVYGDAVLCELADKLLGIFRSNDIVGRIGGDEFIVFLKDCNTSKAAEQKAAEICRAFQLTYQGTEGKKYSISGSVGISFFPQDGDHFNELYSHADIALYVAKSEGKNRYKIYDGSHFHGYTSNRTEIHTIGNILQKGFRENRIEYVFKMLYQAESPVVAIHSVLELVSRHFAFERGYIFETSKDGKTTSNTFEWCAEGVTPEIENLQKVPIEAVATAHASFQKNGTFILKSLDELQPIERDVLEPQGIKSMFQFGIFDKSRLLGFIGFDNCRSESIPSETDIDEMKTICNVLSTFFVKQYIDEVAARDLISRQEVMNHLENYIYVINIETFEVLFMNEKIQELIVDGEEGSSCYRFFRGETQQCENCPVRELFQSGTDRVTCEMYNDNIGFWMETSASLMRWTDGSLACLINCIDITKQKIEHLDHVHELEQLAYIDSLTECYTYHKFKIEAKRILEQNPDDLHFLVKLDVNNFKLINQIYGYEKGDEILRFVAKAIELTTRSEKEIFARVTNDEFIALFTIQKKEEIEELNREFIKQFESLVGSDFLFRCSFPHGRYMIEPEMAKNMDVSEMFEKVNMAHKAAKSNKAVDFVFYDEVMTKDALRIKQIENKMEEALRKHEFLLYIQPKYNLRDETIGGAEALTRWENEDRDLFFPNTFIPIFEKNGFITKLDFYMFEKVCRTIAGWIEQGIEPVVVSVNFSRLHLNNAGFVKELCSIVDRVGIERRYLEIEITETVIFDNMDTLEELLEDIHNSGFSMSMDDFGSGYSSLGMLKNFPVDVIKMDRSFFANQKDVKRSKTVVGNIIRMASELGIRIVAEGVEEADQISFLKELNCDMVQGYYYARPMPEEDFKELLLSDRKKSEIQN